MDLEKGKLKCETDLTDYKQRHNTQSSDEHGEIRNKKIDEERRGFTDYFATNGNFYSMFQAKPTVTHGETQSEKKVKKERKEYVDSFAANYNFYNRNQEKPTVSDGKTQNDKQMKEDRREHSGRAATENIYNTFQAKPTVVDFWMKDKEHKTIRIPHNFPGKRLVSETKSEITTTKIVKPEEQTISKITMDDLQKVLSPRRDKKSKKINEEKLPKIRNTKAREKSTQSPARPRGGTVNPRGGSTSPRGGSHHFNYARMITELNEVCEIKDNTVPQEERDILSLKTIQETRRFSMFTPRMDDDRSRQHTRSRSVPNLNTSGFPKRYFVKLDPVRASASPVNLRAWNESSHRCRVVSENLRRLDEAGVETSEIERKALIGQWIRETTQERLGQHESHLTAEVES